MDDHQKIKNIDLVMREDDFVIYRNDKPLLTRWGSEVSHYDSRLLKHVMIRLALSHEPVESVTCYILFSYQKDKLATHNDLLFEKINVALKNDYLVQPRFHIDSPDLMNLKKAIQLTKNNPQVFNLLFWSASTIAAALEELFSLFKVTPDDDFDSFVVKVEKIYNELPDEKKAGTLLLCLTHDIGLILPLMLMFNIISPSEYANAVLVLGTHNLAGEAEGRFKNLIVPDAEFKLHIIDWQNPADSFALFYTEALETIEYISFFQESKKKISVIEEIIRQGENDRVEFKSSLRWDVRQAKKNPAIEHAALKTMCAFLNSNGGTLLLGVEDNGEITGVEKDQFANDDKFLLHLWNLIKAFIGQDASPYITTTLGRIAEKNVCRVECRAVAKPVFLRQKGFAEEFYIRTGPGSSSLTISETMEYIADHFNGS